MFIAFEYFYEKIRYEKNDALYICSHGKVAAVSKSDGLLLWEVDLKGYAGINVRAIGQIVVDGDKLFIGTGGVLICLSAADGAFIWKNELKGWGYNFISIANAESGAASTALATAAQAATAGAVVATMAGS